MTVHKTLSLGAALVLFFIMALPVAAAQRTFDLKIPGCAS